MWAFSSSSMDHCEKFSEQNVPHPRQTLLNVSEIFQLITTTRGGHVAGAGEARSAIHRPFEEFELVHLTFHLPIGMDHSQPCEDSLFVSFKSLSKALHFAKPTLSNMLFPVFESMTFALAGHLPKGLNESMQR